MPFFKIVNDELSKANEVYAPDYTLDGTSDKTKVVDGWQWFDTLNEALRGIPLAGGAVPQSVTRRQAKTIMELSPHPAGNLWIAALAAANAIHDAQTRIVTVNYLLESLNFEYPTVLAMASQLLGMTATQVDALFVAAAKL
jgi:hypothetical protein